jgi:hypothetical protein
MGLKIVLAAASWLLVVGCGGGGAAKFSSGVDGTKPLGMVSPAEAEQICKASQSYVQGAISEDKQKQLGCKTVALLAAALGGMGGNASQLQSACQTAYDGCLKSVSTPPGSSSSSCATPSSKCTATVAEYEACLTAVPGLIDSALAAIPSCNNLTPAALQGSGAQTVTAPAACKTFEMKCPGFSVAGLPDTLSPP